MFHQENTTSGKIEKVQAFVNGYDRVYLLIAAIFLGIAVMDPDQVIPMATLTMSNLAHTSIYLAIAVALVAFLKASGGEAVVAVIFKGRENRMIVLAALVGGLAPFCSCEVIPFIAGLLALGTPLAPIMAFWLSSPLIDPPTLLITAGALGMKFAVAKAFFAVMLGLFGGFVVKKLSSSRYYHDLIDSPSHEGPNPLYRATFPVVTESCCPESTPDGHAFNWRIWKDAGRRHVFSAELRTNGLFLLKWMLFAYSIESVMIHYVPAHAIASVVGGDGFFSILVSALIGVPAYLNSYIAPPLVSGLMEQGMSAGSGMAFIIAGAVTSIPAMTAVLALVHKKIFALYVMLGFFGAVLSGSLYNLIG